MDNENTNDTGATSQKSEFDLLAQELKALAEAVRDSQKSAQKTGEVRSEDQEKIAKMEAEIVRLREDADKAANSKRLGSFSVDEDSTATRAISPENIKSILALPSTKDSTFSEIQNANDDLYIGMVALGLDTPWRSRSLSNYVKGAYPKAFKAMETSTSSAGGSFIPTGFSRNLIELVQLELRVAALHSRFNMPTNPYTFPVEGADIDAYKVAEATGDNSSITAADLVGAGTPGTANNTFTASKVGVRVVLSGEINEDSIIPTIPFARMKMVRALAQAQENTVINGDTRLSGNIDGVTVGTVQTTAYDGYRRAVQLAGTTYDGSTFNISNLRAVRAGMGVYGVDTGRLAYVCSIAGYHKLLGLSEVITVDKFGARATVLNGQLGSIDGIPIIISEFVSDTMTGAGINRGTSNKTGIYLVRRDMFQFGDWRQPTLKTRDAIESDQTVLVCLTRLAFKSLFTASASQKFAGALVNVTP